MVDNSPLYQRRIDELQIPIPAPDREDLPKDYRGLSVLFNADALEGTGEIIVAEGEIDALSLIEKGVRNVVGITAGAGSFYSGMG